MNDAEFWAEIAQKWADQNLETLLYLDMASATNLLVMRQTIMNCQHDLRKMAEAFKKLAAQP